MESKFEQYDSVKRDFQQFFGQDELTSILDRKADLELLRRIKD